MSSAAFGLGEIVMRRNLAGVWRIASAGRGWLDRAVPVIRELQCWIDPVDRDGPHTMAVDEWLCHAAQAPVLRVYRWRLHWCSIGYFGEIGPAMRRIECANWVRRITGGGVVDHRDDWTYSLVIPKTEPVANWRGNASYRAIHGALAAALRAEGIGCRLSSDASVAGESLCFANPVDHDLVDAMGNKLAGAGQRRSREGLLHQGSVAIPSREADSNRRAFNLAAHLAGRVRPVEMHPDAQTIQRLVGERYARESWLLRR